MTTIGATAVLRKEPEFWPENRVAAAAAATNFILPPARLPGAFRRDHLRNRQSRVGPELALLLCVPQSPIRDGARARRRLGHPLDSARLTRQVFAFRTADFAIVQGPLRS